MYETHMTMECLEKSLAGGGRFASLFSRQRTGCKSVFWKHSAMSLTGIVEFVGIDLCMTRRTVSNPSRNFYPVGMSLEQP